MNRATGPKGVPIEKNITRHRPTIERTENEQTEVVIERNSRIEIISGRPADTPRTGQLHTEIARQVATEPERSARVCVALDVADAHARVRHEIDAEILE